VKVALQIDQLWFTAPGGIGTYVWELADALPRLDDPPELMPFRARFDSDPWREPPSGLPAPVQLTGSVRRLYPSWDVMGRPPLPRTLAGCDVVHATNHASVPPAGDGQALVVTVHDLAFDRFPELFPRDWRWVYRAGVRAAVKRADLLVVPTDATKRDLVERGGDPDRIRVTPLASSLPEGDADVDEVLARIGIERPYVLCPATIEPRKNQVRLVRAYRQVAAELPHELVLAGPEGWLTAELQTEIDHGGSGTVRRVGRLGPEDLDAVYRGADAVAYPSLYEGFGLVIVEAMARGVPLVTSTTPACAEVAGDAALLVEPLDVGGLADALVRVLGDEALRTDLASKGRERAAGFSWEATARATLGAYREAVERARA
jgi:glycosyltransferase involved in cell wall biosynthesis